MTNKKPKKYNGVVGGPDVQTKKETWLFDRKYQPGLAFGPLFTCKNWWNFNPTSRVNPSLKNCYPARGLTWLDYWFHVNAYKHLTAEGLPATVMQPGLKRNPGSCKEALSLPRSLVWWLCSNESTKVMTSRKIKYMMKNAYLPKINILLQFRDEILALLYSSDSIQILVNLSWF